MQTKFAWLYKCPLPKAWFKLEASTIEQSITNTSQTVFCKFQLIRVRGISC